MKQIETKDLAFEVKSISEDGTFEGYVSLYNVPDLGGDIVEPGAFTKTLQERPEVALLWEHKEAIGTARLEDRPEGLWVKGKLTLPVRRAAESYALLKDQALKGISYGFETIKKSFAGGFRRLQEVRLHEVSLTAIPMHPGALVMNVKSGRRISAATASEINSAIALLSSLLEEAGAHEATTSPAAADTPAAEPVPDHSGLVAQLDSMIAQIPTA